MVALFYSVFPDEAQKYLGEYREYKAYSQKHYYVRFYDDYDDYDDYDEDCYDCEEDYEEFEDVLRGYIRKLSKTQLQNALFQLLYDGTEEQMEQFIIDYVE